MMVGFIKQQFMKLPGNGGVEATPKSGMGIRRGQEKYFFFTSSLCVTLCKCEGRGGDYQTHIKIIT
jgi:hypothetical protein